MSLSRLIPLLIVVVLLSFAVGRCSSVLFETEDAGETAKLLKHPHKEIKRVKSPDGLVEAVFIEIETDSLSANGFIICIVPTGKNIEELTRSYEPNIFYANRIEDLNIVWKEPKLLEVRYKRAAILVFRNYLWMNNVGNQDKYVIELRLIPEDEHSLPF